MVDLRRSARAAAAAKRGIPESEEINMSKKSKTSESTKPPAGEDETGVKGEELWKLSKDESAPKGRRGSKSKKDATKPPAGEDETGGKGEELWKLPRGESASSKARRGSRTSKHKNDSSKPPAGEDETGVAGEELWKLPRKEGAESESTKPSAGEDETGKEGEELWKLHKDEGAKPRRGSKSSDKTKPLAGEDETGGEGEDLWKLPKKDEKETDVAEDSDQTAQSTELDIGDEIPDVTLQNQDGKDVSLRDVAKEHKIIIIFAYPKASTPGCTRQACGYRDNYDELKEHAAVFGLSGDNASAQKKFQTKQSLPFDLLCDPGRVLIGHLGAKKTAQSGTLRSHWVFFDGKLKYKRVKVSPEVSIQDGKKEVLELAASLQNE